MDEASKSEREGGVSDEGRAVFREDVERSRVKRRSQLVGSLLIYTGVLGLIVLGPFAWWARGGLSLLFLIVCGSYASRAKPRGNELTMRKALLLTGLLLVVIALSMLPPCSNLLYAQSGCCKTRNALNAPWRKALDLTFAACRQLNEKRDGDDVFAESGLVWWDRQCS